METKKTAFILSILYLCVSTCDSAKINTPRVLLPWFENLNVNFTFEIHEGGCYTWSLSRDDIIDLEPLYEDTWGHCSHAARVSVSKTCVPPGSVIILAEEVSTGEILRGDVDIAVISALKVISTTWKLYLEEAPEAFEVVAYDDQGNTFSTLEGVSFTWIIENLGNNIGEDLLVTFVRWRDTDYEAPRGVAELEAQGLRSYSVLLYGQAMGESRVTACLGDICTYFNLRVVASVVLTPAVAMIAPGDTLRYKVVRARAGRLTSQDITETLYYIQLPDNDVARLEDSISLVRGSKIGTTTISLMSGATDVATATLTVTEPHSIRVTLRPSSLLIRGEVFVVHCVLLDANGHALVAGDEVLIRISVDGEANVDLLRSTENGTITDAVALNSGALTVTARLHSIAGKILSRKVESQVSAVAVEPLEMVPPELYVAWTDNTQEITLKHRGGGDEPVVWSESETPQGPLTLAPTGEVTIRGVGDIAVSVHLKMYPHVRATGRVWSAPVELIQVSSSGHARVGRAHHLHVALTATHPTTGELYNFHTCDCASFAVSLLEGPEPQNVTAAPWVQPVEGACCVVECAWSGRGVATVRVARGRGGDTARVAVRAAPALLWPRHAAALRAATLPVLAEGEALVPQSREPRTAELAARDGEPPHLYPDIQLFTLKCHRKGETRLVLTSQSDEEQESVQLDAACAPYVSRIRLEPPEAPGNCTGSQIWLRPGQEVSVKVTLLDVIGRELLDELGPRMSWEIEPKHVGIEYRATDRLFVETHPDFFPVPVPYKYYQLVIAEEKAVGWSGVLKASIPEATASIQAKVVAPLKCEPIKANIAWESETVSNIATVSGGSGRYAVEAPKGVSASIDGGALTAVVPGPGFYDLLITDLCVHGEKVHIEVNIEEVVSVEVTAARAVGAGACVRVAAVARGAARRRVAAAREAQWRVAGPAAVRAGLLCGLREGVARVRAQLAGLWSPDFEVLVFPPLEIVPGKARVPPGARLQLRHAGGPPPHLAALRYAPLAGAHHAEVSSTGSVHGVSVGTTRVRLVATDTSNVEMASAESEIEVIPISGLRVKAATQTLLVGAPSPVWVEGEGLSAAALASLYPPPRVTWTIRDATAARLYTTHADDKLERSAAEGLSVRVVPLKPGVITIDVRVRNLGQVAETRSWDSTIEILGISDILVSVDGLPRDLSTGDRLALAVGSVVHLRAVPRGAWKAHGDGAFSVSSSGEVTAVKPGHGVIIAHHKDERNNIYRETSVHVEVSVPQYCTSEPAGDTGEAAVRLVMRDAAGRELVAPRANVSAAPLVAHARPSLHSIYGNELLIAGLDAAGAFMTFEGTVSGVTVTDQVWVTGSDSQTERIVATGGWGVCLEGVGWRAPAGVALHAGAGVTLALLARDAAAAHALRRDRPPSRRTLHQVPVHKMEFLAGEWPSTMVPLSIEAPGATSGPLLCTEEQRYALDGVQVELPYACLTQPPHTAQPVLDIINGEIGCKIIPSDPITSASEAEVCAEWGALRTCARAALLPPVRVSRAAVSLLAPPPVFTVAGHPRALRLLKFTTSPGLEIETTPKDGEISVLVKSEASTCGIGWVNVKSRLTAQEVRVEVERECEIACGTLLGALFSLLRPYLPTAVTVAALAAAYLYIQSRLQQKTKIRMPTEPAPSVAPPQEGAGAGAVRVRTWSRSPYASAGPAPSPAPAAPVYGDASVLPDSSFSPTSTRTHSRFL